MTELLEIVSRLEQAGGTLSLDGDRIRFAIPRDNQEAQELLAQLREHRDSLAEILRRRESQDAVRRFGQPHARLFPFIGRKVQTPGGPGTLLQVFAERVTVLLDSEVSRCAFFQPRQVEPLSKELDS